MSTADGLWRRQWRTCNGALRWRLYLVEGDRALQLQSGRWVPLADLTRQRGTWEPHTPPDGKPWRPAL